MQYGVTYVGAQLDLNKSLLKTLSLVLPTDMTQAVGT